MRCPLLTGTPRACPQSLASPGPTLQAPPGTSERIPGADVGGPSPATEGRPRDPTWGQRGTEAKRARDESVRRITLGIEKRRPRRSLGNALDEEELREGSLEAIDVGA